MSQDIRRELIAKNLGIKPINHGLVHAFQIAIPDSRKQTISLEQRQAIERSLLAHQSNLISLIIRRTNTYVDEDIEYELVYGADWLQIAQELEIEKIWAWVFDMTNEQVIAAIAEMESLTPNGIDSDISALIDKKLQLATDSIKNSITSLLTGIKNDLDEKLKVVNYKLDEIIDKDKRINLLTASNRKIEVALKKEKTQNQQIKAAIEAIQYWRQSEQGLTWNNLEISAKAKKSSQDKIKGFAEKTYEVLRAVAVIPEQDNAE